LESPTVFAVYDNTKWFWRCGETSSAVTTPMNSGGLYVAKSMGSCNDKNKSLVSPEPTRAAPNGLSHHPRLSAAQSLEDLVLAIFY